MTASLESQPTGGAEVEVHRTGLSQSGQDNGGGDRVTVIARSATTTPTSPDVQQPGRVHARGAGETCVTGDHEHRSCTNETQHSFLAREPSLRCPTPNLVHQARTPSAAEALALAEYVQEQNLLYTLLERQYLPSPYLFVSCAALQMSLKDRLRAVDMHYKLNEGLAELWFGDRLSRIDVEDDDLLEVGHPGLLEASVKRQWRNLKRVCKLMTSAYRGREGMYISREIPLSQAIEEVFVLPKESARLYATLVFGFEHRLDCASLEPLEVHELSSLCSAVAACWCDGSELMLSEPYCKACWSLGKLLEDSRIVAELEGMIMGGDAAEDGPPQRLLRQIKDTFDEMQKAIASSPSINAFPPAAPSQQHNGTAAAHVNSSQVGGGAALAAGVSSATLESLFGGSVTSVADAQPPLHHSTGEHTSKREEVETAQPPHPSRATPPPPPPQRYSRRVVTEFKSIVKNLSRISTQFSTSEKLRDVFDRFHTKVYSPLLQLGKVDASSAVAAAAAASCAGMPAASASGAVSEVAPTTSTASLLCTTNGSIAAFPTVQQFSAALAAANNNNGFDSADRSSSHATTVRGDGGGGSGSAQSGKGTPAPLSTSSYEDAEEYAHNSGEAPPHASNASANESLLRAVESRRYIRELSVLLADLSKAFPKLKLLLSSKVRDELDVCASDFFAVLRLYTQLLLAHDS